MLHYATGKDPGQKAVIDASGQPLDGYSLKAANRSAYAFMQCVFRVKNRPISSLDRYPRCENVTYKGPCVIEGASPARAS